MALVMGSGYTVNALNAILTALAFGWKVRLFSNDYTPVDGSVISDFTESTFVGYSAPTPSWTEGTDTNGNAILTSNTLSYTFTPSSGSALAYGYFMTDPNQTPEAYVGGERFGSSVTFTPGNPSLDLKVIVGLAPEF